MEAIIVLALIIAGIAWLVLPFVTLAKVSGISWEIQELKMLVKRLDKSDVRAKAKPEVVTKPEAKAEVEAKPEGVAKPQPLVPPHVPASEAPCPQPRPEPEPTMVDGLWTKFEDWFCVRGDFAPKGTTREFAVATRWLTRVGALLLVGAIAYFLMLAIDKGWIGPVQRVCGMMAWGVLGTAFGTRLKLKSERYAILGEVCAAVGLVALYLSFGLGHRFFKPPVIESGYVAFAGLLVATLAAGSLSVRLRSLMIAGLALAGGFLVPTICSFTSHDVQLHSYLFVISLGACAVAYFRNWALYAFVAIAVSVLFSHAKCGVCADGNGIVAYMFQSFEFALFLALSIRTSLRMEKASRSFCWAAVSIAGIYCLSRMHAIAGCHCACRGVLALHHFAWACVFAALAYFSRRREWGGTPVFIVFSCVCAVFSVGEACVSWWCINDATVVLVFCAFAALLAELGARSGERTLQAVAILAAAAMSFISFAIFLESVGNGSGDVHGYVRDLVDRIQYLWSAPAMVVFVGWRVGDFDLWRDWLRKASRIVASVMVFCIVTAESHLFGREFLPVLRGGFVTMTWAAVASALLAAGIVRRVKVARLVGLGVLALSVAKLLLVDTASLATPGRVGVFAAVGALLIAGAFLYLRFKARFKDAGAEARQPSAEARHPARQS